MTTDNFCFYLQNRLIQTSKTGGQQYNDTSPFSIPCSCPLAIPPQVLDNLSVIPPPSFQTVYVGAKIDHPVIKLIVITFNASATWKFYSEYCCDEHLIFLSSLWLNKLASLTITIRSIPAGNPN